MDFSGTYRSPVTTAWLGCDLGTDTLKVVPPGRCRDTRKGWCESVLWKWSRYIRRAGGFINLGAEWSSLGWCIHRLLLWGQADSLSRVTVSLGFPHLWCRDWSVIPGHWPSDRTVGCSWENRDFSDQKCHLVPKKMFQTNLVVYIPAKSFGFN